MCSCIGALACVRELAISPDPRSTKASLHAVLCDQALHPASWHSSTVFTGGDAQTRSKIARDSRWSLPGKKTCPSACTSFQPPCSSTAVSVSRALNPQLTYMMRCSDLGACRSTLVSEREREFRRRRACTCMRTGIKVTQRCLQTPPWRASARQDQGPCGADRLSALEHPPAARL